MRCMMIHLALTILILLGGRAVFIFFRPQKADGRFRLGARLVRRAHLAARDAWLEWRYGR